MVELLLRDHFRLAVHGAILFAVGLFAAMPVVRYKIRAVRWLPMRLFGLVLRLMGERPGFVRVAVVIWLFNSTVMFLCMASGLHALLPKVLGIWTGLNVGVLAATAGQADHPGFHLPTGGDAQWRPSPRVALACGLLVVALELPCFWYALGMGMSLAGQVGAGAGYFSALQPRALAYACLILPALLVSAAAESVAIRGGTAADGGRQ